MADMTAEERAREVAQLAPVSGSIPVEVRCGNCGTNFTVAGQPMYLDLLPLQIGITQAIRDAESAAYKRGCKDGRDGAKGMNALKHKDG